MTRRPLRFRLLALVLELAGVGAILGAVFAVAPIVALILAGVTVIVAAQFVERVL